MQPVARRILIVAAIAIGGGVLGVSLGNFVSSGNRKSGLEELAAYNAMLRPDNGGADENDARPAASIGAQNGPTSYNCKGCDASLYNDVVPGNVVEPIAPYDPEAGRENLPRKRKAKAEEAPAMPDVPASPAPDRN